MLGGLTLSIECTSHQQRPMRAQIVEEEEPYDPYLELLAPEAVVQ